MNNQALMAVGIVAVAGGVALYINRAGNIDILARTIWGEARGEDMRGRIAVANVVMNRVADARWPNSVRAVCLQPFQFSTWNHGDPNRNLVLAVDASDAIFLESLSIARAAIDGKLGDLTDGANHYHARTISPNWASAFTKTAEIGSHLFFNG